MLSALRNIKIIKIEPFVYCYDGYHTGLVTAIVKNEVTFFQLKNSKLYHLVNGKYEKVNFVTEKRMKLYLDAFCLKNYGLSVDDFITKRSEADAKEVEAILARNRELRGEAA